MNSSSTLFPRDPRKITAGIAARERPEEVARARVAQAGAGASIYAGSYVFGSNFDYRLAFLVLCVPQLSVWARPSSSPLPGARAALGALVLTLWLSSDRPPLPFGLQSWYTGLSFPPEEILNWLLFAWLVAAVAVSAPLAIPRHLAWRSAP